MYLSPEVKGGCVWCMVYRYGVGMAEQRGRKGRRYREWTGTRRSIIIISM